MNEFSTDQKASRRASEVGEKTQDFLTCTDLRWGTPSSGAGGTAWPAQENVAVTECRFRVGLGCLGGCSSSLDRRSQQLTDLLGDGETQGRVCPEVPRAQTAKVVSVRKAKAEEC